MINFDDVAGENRQEHNPRSPRIPIGFKDLKMFLTRQKKKQNKSEIILSQSVFQDI